LDEWIAILLPFVLLMARVTAFFSLCPIFGWRSVPVVIRAGTAVLMTVFFAVIVPPTVGAHVHWLLAVVLILQETVVGLAIGLVARLVYSAVQQGGLMAAQQMGFADAGCIDPSSGARSRPIATLFEMTFAMLFLIGGGHHLLLWMIARSFQSFPVAGRPDLAVLVGGVVKAGSAMLLFGLKLAAPMLASFLILAVLLCILARVLPEMNILLASFPLRVGMGLFMAAAMMPSLNSFTSELAKWISEHVVT